MLSTNSKSRSGQTSTSRSNLITGAPKKESFLTCEELVTICNYLQTRKKEFCDRELKNVGTGLQQLNHRIATCTKVLQDLTRKLKEVKQVLKEKENQKERVNYFDQVFSLVFSHPDIDIPTLKTCRLVSRSLNLLATSQLQKSAAAPLSENKINLSGKSEDSIDQLISLMLFHAQSTKSNFPCLSFQVKTNDLSLPHLQNFFTLVGFQVKDLILLPFDESKSSKFATTKQDDVKILTLIIKNLKTLLTIQAPNIKSLHLDGIFPYFLNKEIASWDSTLTLEQPQKFFDFKNALPKLKHFSTKDFPSTKILLEILDAASSLKTLSSISRDCRQNLALLNYFCENRNRGKIHLLKHLILFANDETIEVLARILKIHGGNSSLKLETLEFKNYQFFHRLSKNLWPVFTEVINALLIGSRDTLKSLVMRHVGFLPGVKFPQMPKMKEIVVKAYQRELMSFPGGDYYYFPSSCWNSFVVFSIRWTFPGLKKIIVENEVSSGEFQGRLAKLLRIRKQDESREKVGSVKVLELKGRGGEVCVISDTLKTAVRKKFPNVKIISLGLKVEL